jgi:RHS repeat-associated protein
MTLEENSEIVSAQDYYPYGEILRSYTLGSGANNKYYFTEKERDTETNYDYFGARYYDSELGRWLQVDPLADKYPGWSPYNYALNNPLRYIDPNGMWSAERDENGNIIARYEDGDTYANLYNQLGISAERFASWTASQNIELSLDPKGSSFNITEFVLKQNNFSSDNANLNCYSSSLYGTGALSEEMVIPTSGANYNTTLKEVFNYKQKENITPGSLVTWTNNSTNVVEHMAIFVIKGNDGTSYFVGRPGQNSDVVIQNSENTSRSYPGYNQQFFDYTNKKPKF